LLHLTLEHLGDFGLVVPHRRAEVASELPRGVACRHRRDRTTNRGSSCPARYSEAEQASQPASGGGLTGGIGGNRPHPLSRDLLANEPTESTEGAGPTQRAQQQATDEELAEEIRMQEGAPDCLCEVNADLSAGMGDLRRVIPELVDPLLDLVREQLRDPVEL